MICLPARPARAQEPAPFGAEGQWLVGGSLGATYQHAAQDSERDVKRLGLWVAPAALHFVARDFALGASLALGIDRYDYVGGRQLKEDSIGGSALFAYRVGLGASTFLLPEFALGVLHVERSMSVAGGAFGPDGSNFDRYRFVALRALYSVGPETRLQSTLSLPLCFSPAPTFFFGFGPYVRGEYALDGDLGLGGGDWRVTLGLSSVLGSWF